MDIRHKEKMRLTIHNQPDGVGEHFHQDIELLYLLEGTMKVTQGDQDVWMQANDILVINANKTHSIKASDNVLLAKFAIDYNMVSDVFNSINIIFWCDSTKGNNERYEELRKVLKSLLSHYLATSGNTASFAYISHYYRVLDLLSSYFLVQTADKENGDEGEKFDDRIRQINNYIRANYNQQISLKELSEKLFLSNGYLSRFFKKNYGMNFAEYLTSIRLYHAVDELLYTNTPITTITYNNGFAGVAAFNKAFKKNYGETPSVFRKKSKEQRDEEEKITEENQDVTKQLEKYLVSDEKNQSQELTVETLQNRHSVKNQRLMDACWGRTINMGMASDILKSQIQEHIILLKEALGFEYVRFFNPFTKKMLIDIDNKAGKYNFTSLDNILDFLIAQGLKPHMELGPKPEMIIYSVQKIKVEGQKNVEFMDDEEWKQLIEAMLLHLARRYGRDELDSWRMELWFNENKWDDEDAFEKYWKLFDTLYEVVRKYSDKLKVGGAGLRTDYQEKERIRFYIGWKARSIHPDFLSVMLYPYDRGEEKQDRYAKRCTDNECFKHYIKRERELLAISNLSNIPVFVTEWNLTISTRNAMNDSCFKGAYVVKNILDIYSEVADMAYCLGSDRGCEYFDTNELLYGGTGIISKDGIFKPAGFAFEFLHRLYSYFVGSGENYLISTDCHDSYGIVCHNQRVLGYNYYFTKEDEIERNHLWKYFEDRDVLNLNLELEDMTNGEYQIKIYRINQSNGSVLDIWEDMEFESDLSRGDVKYFQRACEPKMVIQKAQVTQNLLKLEVSMQPNEIAFVRIRLLVS